MRRMTIVLATMLLAVSAYVATFGLWAAADVADRESFVESALVSFQREGSDDALGEVVAGKVIERFPALGLLRGPLSSLFSALITTEAFRPARVAVSEEIHAVVFEGEFEPVVIDLADYRDAVLASVGAISPDLADQIPEGAFSTFVIYDAGELPDASGAIGVVITLGWLSLVLALGLVALLVLSQRDASVFLLAIGAGLLGAAVALIVIVFVAGRYVGTAAPNDAYSVLGRNLYDVLVGPLRSRALAIGAIGVVMIGISVVARRVSNRWTSDQV